MTTSIVLMLEDDNDRLSRFLSIFDHLDQIEFAYSKTADGFKDLFSKLNSEPALICLDHDLFPDDVNDPDPGDGRDVAEFLANLKPICHIIIHSSNSAAAISMYYTLEEAGWSVERVAPIGDDWIESYWWPIAKEHIRGNK